MNWPFAITGEMSLLLFGQSRTAADRRATLESIEAEAAKLWQLRRRWSAL